MAINDISLTAGMRSNLVSLQNTEKLLNQTQERLSTGKKVNSALDDPGAFFAARGHYNRAADLAALKDGMGEAVQTIKSADSGIDAINAILESMKALANDALTAEENRLTTTLASVTAGETVDVGTTTYTIVTSGATATSVQVNQGATDADTANNLAAQINAQVETGQDMKASVSGATLTIKGETTAITNVAYLADGGAGTFTAIPTEVISDRDDLAVQYNTLVTQMNSLADDSTYKGKNLLKSDTLTVEFETGTLGVVGFDATASGRSISTTATGGSGVNAWANATDINTDIALINTAVDSLESEAKKLASNLTTITIRQDFTTELQNVLTEGGDNLTLADLNEEGANMLALQTQQALGSTSLSLAAQAAQSVLRLF